MSHQGITILFNNVTLQLFRYHISCSVHYLCLINPAVVVITLLILAAVTFSGTTTELSETTGDTVYIPCLFEEGTIRNIFWFYNNGTGRHKILSIFKGILTVAAEYVDRASLQDDNSTLIFKDITVADEGTYCCDVDRQGQTPVTNIETNLNVFSLRPDTLPVISPNCNWTVDASSCRIHDNQSFNLICTLPNVYPVQGTELIWYQDGQRVSSTADVTQNDDGTTDTSRHIQVSETGNFTCNVTYLSVNGKENTAASVEAWITLSVDVTTSPGNNLTKGQIAWIIVPLVGIFLVIMILCIYIYRPKRRGLLPSTDDFDDTLVAVAKKVRKDAEIDTLGKKLKFSPEDIQRYIHTNLKTQGVTYDGTLQMLRDWRKKETGSTEREALKTALEQSEQTHLADELFSSDK